MLTGGTTIKPLFQVQPTWARKDAYLDLAREKTAGVEVASFSQGPGLNDPKGRREQTDWYRRTLEGFPSLSYHGAFLDLTPHSQDAALAGLVRARFVDDLKTAAEIGCHRIVFHTGYNPMIKVADYDRLFFEKQIPLWQSLAESHPELIICLENVWEPSPELFHRLVTGVDHPRVRICFDVAHAHVYSQPHRTEEWFDLLGDRIECMHWNDNHGDRDSHLALGEGNIDWQVPLAWLSGQDRVIPTTLEFSDLEKTRQSFEFLEAQT